MRNRLGNSFKNWLYRLSRNRNLKRIDRLMGLSDMKLGKKTRKYFLRLHKNLAMRERLVNISTVVSNICSTSFDTFIFFPGSILLVNSIVFFIGICSDLINRPLETFPIIMFFNIGMVILATINAIIAYNSPSEYTWNTRYKSCFTHTGPIGKVMNRLWKNNNGSGVKSNNDNRFFSNYFEGFNQMASLLNMNMDYLDEPEYWSDEDYGRFMRIVLSYAFIYESVDGHPDEETLTEFINSDEVQNTAREVLDDVRERKDRICGTDTNKDTNTEESSSIADNLDPVIVSQNNDRIDPNIIRSEDIQSRIVSKTGELHNILDSEMQIEK